jgi:glycosyltransferase involved in cell wall biosynthesis
MISVVMPVYNHVHFVREAIDSILNQTYKNFELILVDDGSTDGSSKVLKKYANGNNIKYFYKNNEGTGKALNLGFSHATGKYGTWVSSDNMYYPKFLQTLRCFLEEYSQCRLVFSSFSLNGKRDWYPPGKVPVKGVLENFLDKSFGRCITGICYLFHMTLKRECGEYISIPGEDYVMGVQMGIKTQVGYTPESLGMWRNHPDTITQQLCLNKYKHSFVDASGRTANQISIDLIKESRGG